MKKNIIFIYIIFMSFVLFSKTVLTNTQATYTLTSMLAENTDIKVKSLFETSASMSYDQIQTLKSIPKESYNDVVAVVDLQRVWIYDSLFEFARRENIKVIEIDASYSYQDNTSLSLLINNYHKGENIGQTNPYVWLDLGNANKMTQIIAHDLIRLFPENKDVINKNLEKTLNILEKLAEEYNSLDNIDGVIVLSENLNYLITYLNIFSEYVNINDLSVSNIKKIMKQTDLKVFVSDKGIKKEIVEEIKKNKGTVVILKTGNLPVEDEDDEDLMAKDGLIQIYKNNLNKLKKIK